MELIIVSGQNIAVRRSDKNKEERAPTNNSFIDTKPRVLRENQVSGHLHTLHLDFPLAGITYGYRSSGTHGPPQSCEIPRTLGIFAHEPRGRLQGIQ